MTGLRRPSIFAVLLTLSGVAAFVALGIWQLHRASYHAAVLASFANAARARVEPFAAAEQAMSAEVYPHVQVQGSFEPDRTYLLDNRMQGGQLGVDVYAAFAPHNRDRILLVDLGFLPRKGQREQLPVPPALPRHPVTLSGVYAPAPAPGLKLGGNALPGQAHWPKLLTWIDLGDIAADLQQQTYPRVLLLDADPSSAYVRSWTPDVMPPARNRAYAFQWFTFALVAVVIFFVMHRQAPRDRH